MNVILAFVLLGVYVWLVASTITDIVKSTRRR